MIALLLALSLLPQTVVVIMRNAEAVTCSTGGSDDFSTDPFASRWNKDLNEDAIGITYDGTNQRLNCTTAGSGDYNHSVYTSGGGASANMWVKAQIGWSGSSPKLTYGITLRRSTVASPVYLIMFALGTDTTASWRYWADDGTTAPVTIADLTGCGSFSVGDYIGARVTGTGNDTVLDLWKNPSGSDPDDWGAACATDTTDPGTAVDSGVYGGVYCRATSATSVTGYWDNFSSGSCE